MPEAVLGFDVGGTGARGALAPLDDRDPAVVRGVRAVPLRKGPRGVDGLAVADTLTGLADELLARRPEAKVVAVAVGCSGAATLGDDLREQLPGALARATGSRLILICSDLLTAFFGALAGEPGTVLAVGTGVVAVSSDLTGSWRQVDGWGDIAGDLGGGSWIGRAGIRAALCAGDGRRDGSAVLAAEARRQFGDPRPFAAGLSGREDRAAVLASFAPCVLAAARSGDPVAVRIRARACRHLADTVLAAMPGDHDPADPDPTGRPGVVATTGALLDSDAGFRAGLLAELPAEVEIRRGVGTGCAGALRLARYAVAGSLPPGVLGLVTLHRY